MLILVSYMESLMYNLQAHTSNWFTNTLLGLGATQTRADTEMFPRGVNIGPLLRKTCMASQ